ncbi:sugar phosphate isomerase/epimerase family protein [Kozakia baliensis]|nr:sugar phosphate isomerase/epimerase family protein [Kozakia baliensis]GBR33318.1 4-hydroxyphenylpyruvate dioxygenase [Kozakia baliensis NRIC 0488]GEL65692.1 hypothetical protein KBA01_29780 [Kozakia baliensis]
MSNDQKMPFLFGMNEFTTQPWSFEEDVARYKALGVDAIEICEAKLDRSRAGEQIEFASETGLIISAIQPAVRTFFGSKMVPSPFEPNARADAFEYSLKSLAPYAPGSVFICNTGAPPNGNIQFVLDETIRYLRRLCPIALDLGVSLALEPLNPVSMNLESAICTIAQTMDIIDGVGHPAIGLCLDYWNIWQEDNVEAQISRAGSKISVLQASDWRVPLSGADRLIPGDGSIPLGTLLRATHDAGYRGACTVEIFSDGVPDSLYRDDLQQVIQKSRLGLEDAWENIPR